MKIAFTAKGTDWEAKIDPRFGRAEYLLLFDEQSEQLSNFDNRDINYVAHGAGPKTAQKLFELSPQVLITGNGPGGNALNILKKFNLKIFIGADGMTIRDAYKAYTNKQLQQLI